MRCLSGAFGAVMAFVSVELLRYQEDFNMKRVLERMDEQSLKMEEMKKRLDFGEEVRF